MPDRGVTREEVTIEQQPVERRPSDQPIEEAGRTIEPSYRYRYDMRSRPEYRGRAWNEVEPQLRSDWERRYPKTPWDRARESIRDTWENATT